MLRRSAPILSRFVSHYWLTRNNTETAHPVLPDGCIDVVFEIGGTTGTRAYGVASRRAACPMVPGDHYLGVCFRPGQGRHFLTFPADEIADGSTELPGLAGLDPEALADEVARGAGFGRVDAALARWLAREPVAPPDPVDRALDAIDRSHGRVRIERLTRQAGISRRHLERRFLDRVGISPKGYAGIRRWHRALELLRIRPEASLSDIALSAGYTDQSHMNRDFQRRTGNPPRLAAHVAFVQDAPDLPGYLARVT